MGVVFQWLLWLDVLFTITILCLMVIFHHPTISSFRMYLLALRGCSLYHLLESHRLLCYVVSSRLHGYLLHDTMVIMVLVILVMISLILRKRPENSMLNSIMVVLRC